MAAKFMQYASMEAMRDCLDASGAEVDEYAPRTIEALARRTSLPESLLVDMEDALLSRHQIVLTGPPGTSKTFVAREFARYFAREGTGHPQGLTHTLYMHTSWSYEDFFEGLKPVEREGALSGGAARRDAGHPAHRQARVSSSAG